MSVVTNKGNRLLENLKYSKGQTVISCYLEYENETRIPFHVAINQLNIKLPELEFDCADVCNGNCLWKNKCKKCTLKLHQIPLIEEAIPLLKIHRAIIFATETGSGKTCMALFVSNLFKGKTVIIGHN